MTAIQLNGRQEGRLETLSPDLKLGLSTSETTHGMDLGT